MNTTANETTPQPISATQMLANLVADTEAAKSELRAVQTNRGGLLIRLYMNPEDQDAKQRLADFPDTVRKLEAEISGYEQTMEQAKDLANAEQHGAKIAAAEAAKTRVNEASVKHVELCKKVERLVSNLGQVMTEIEAADTERQEAIRSIADIVFEGDMPAFLANAHVYFPGDGSTGPAFAAAVHAAEIGSRGIVAPGLLGNGFSLYGAVLSVAEASALDADRLAERLAQAIERKRAEYALIDAKKLKPFDRAREAAEQAAEAARVQQMLKTAKKAQG